MNDCAQNTKNGFVGQVLLAMPAMTDPRFERSVIYICAHNEDGAMGIVINKTLNSIDSRDLLEELDIPTDPTTRNITVHFGGPVENQRGFVLHSLDYEHAELLVVEGQAGLSATLDILHDLAQGSGPKHSILALGYAGWGPGQLEAEFQENAWLSVPANETLLFDVPNDDKWERAFNSIGVDLSVLSSSSGRA